MTQAYSEKENHPSALNGSEPTFMTFRDNYKHVFWNFGIILCFQIFLLVFFVFVLNIPRSYFYYFFFLRQMQVTGTQRGKYIQAREWHKPAVNLKAVNTIDAAKMATNYIVEKFREIQLFSEVSVSYNM